MEFQMSLLKRPFNLDNTLECGQVFRWTKKNNWWVAVVENRVIKIKQENNVLNVESSSSDTDEKFIRKYFRLSDSLPEILANINKDQVIADAVSKLYGLRIIKQNPWECLASFICATYKNIAAIRKMISNICQHLGQRIDFEGDCHYTFPEPEIIADADRQILENCGLGYRAKYLQKSAKKVSSNDVVLEDLEVLNYETVKCVLLENNSNIKVLPGVGPKVADCVMLFSLDKLEAFPIDVWIRHIINEHYIYLINLCPNYSSYNLKYGSIGNAEYKEISEAMRSYFGVYAGYAQEYLYHYTRMSKITSFTS